MSTDRFSLIDRFPLVEQCAPARSWLCLLEQLGRAEATVQAYARGLSGYLAFCRSGSIDPVAATLEHVALYVRHLRQQPGSRSDRLSNATIQQRLTALRLFYDHLVYAGLCPKSPVPRGHHPHFSSAPRSAHPEAFGRGLVRRTQNLPAIPSDAEWEALLRAASKEPLRGRLMFALAYYGALRREELTRLHVADLDVARRLIRLRAETTKSGRSRVVCYPREATPTLMRYLGRRSRLLREAGPLFLSESNRNRGQPLSIWTWSKTCQRIAKRAGAGSFSTHTLRHLRLTHLARAGWELHALATFAGHRNVATTLQYVHLSGRDLAEKLTRGMAQIHEWRVRTLTTGSMMTAGSDLSGAEGGP